MKYYCKFADKVLGSMNSVDEFISSIDQICTAMTSLVSKHGETASSVFERLVLQRIEKVLSATGSVSWKMETLCNPNRHDVVDKLLMLIDACNARKMMMI